MRPTRSTPTPRRSTATRRWTVALVAAAAVAGPGALPADAAGTRPKIQLSSVDGHAVLDSGGTVTVTGALEGTPLDGTYSAVLTADDGSLPAPGEAEAASVTVRVDGARGQVLVLAGTGEVTGEWTGPYSLRTHLFVGRYEVVESTVRRVRATDGWFSVGVGLGEESGDVGYVEAFDS